MLSVALGSRQFGTRSGTRSRSVSRSRVHVRLCWSRAGPLDRSAKMPRMAEEESADETDEGREPEGSPRRSSLPSKLSSDPLRASGSQAFPVLATDGGRWHVKAPNNPQGSRVLVTEYLMSRVGQLIGAPVCEVSPIAITEEFADFQVVNGPKLAKGIASASRDVADVTEMREHSVTETRTTTLEGMLASSRSTTGAGATIRSGWSSRRGTTSSIATTTASTFRPAGKTGASRRWRRTSGKLIPWGRHPRASMSPSLSASLRRSEPSRRSRSPESSAACPRRGPSPMTS